MYKETLEDLLREALDNHASCENTFEETDCADAMNAAESWQRTVQWLSRKVAACG